ncbi:MAG: mevalonate kinase [Anaerolineales bacterium]|jgi:mevalonate kinase
MPAISASAPGKIILFGEHAVVYNRPAIAVPLTQVKAKAIIRANPLGERDAVEIQAPNIGLEAYLSDLSDTDPLAAAVNKLTSLLGVRYIPACTIRITSSIPVSSGLGSGTAVTVALIRALSAFLGHPLPNKQVCELTYEVEILHHGTPSGIDNTVVTYAMPIFYKRGDAIETFSVRKPFTIVIGDTGIRYPTSITVGDVRKAWQTSPTGYENTFDAIGDIASAARDAIERGDLKTLGALMNSNHEYLQKLGVSSPELDHLVNAARDAGALGAKLSGGGRGGNMIAMVAPGEAHSLAKILIKEGASRSITTEVKS